MPLVESEAIILHTRAFGEAHRLVSFLSRGRGRMRGLAAHARRSRRRFGAGLEPLSHVRLWFFERGHHELVRLSEMELIESFWDARGELERTAALNQMVELCETLLPEREPAEKAFRLLLASLGALKGSDSPWLALSYFQLWSLCLAGWLPAIDRCSRCQRPLAGGPAYSSPARGELACSKCRRPGMRSLSGRTRTAALKMLANPLSKLSAEPWGAAEAAELGGYVLDLIEYHTEHKLVTREILSYEKT
ncbi:MAG: DNA repair protein RecO [Terriglobia bacterium]